MKVLNYTPGRGVSLRECRRFTEQEMENYYKEVGLIGIGEEIKLPGITWEDFDWQKEDCGSFMGSTNYNCEVSDDEWEEYIALSERRIREKEAEEVKEEISTLEWKITGALDLKARLLARLAEIERLLKQ